MKRSLLFILFASLIALVPTSLAAAEAKPALDSSGHPFDLKTLAIGESAPDFALPGIDGRVWRLADLSGTDVLMVLFTSNHCPTSHGIEGRLKKLRDDLRGRSVSIVAINPNHPDGLSVNELGYGEYGDSFEEMKPYAAKLGWDFPYLYDGEKQLTARAYGCLATPHVFIFDRSRRLRYAGAFDDSRYPQEETVKKHYARDAINALLAGRAVPVETTKPFGCSTKWREKRAKHVETEAAWTKISVNLGPIDAAGELPGGKRFSSPRELKAIIAARQEELARNLTEKLPGVPFLFTSSTSVYSQTDGSVVSEESPTEPDRETGRLLLEAERITLDTGGVVARLAGIYGPGRSVILRKFLSGEAMIEEDGRRYLNQIHRDDAARAILHLATNSVRGGIFNVCDSKPLTQLECYQRLSEIFNRPLPPSGPRDLERKRGWTHKRVSNDKLVASGWRPQFPCFTDAVGSIAPTL